MPEVTFEDKPHTISKQLGATNIGFDICDSCNYYFGTKDKTQKYQMSIELAFKEVLSVMRLLLKPDLNEHTYKTFKSIYFSYHHSKKTIKISNSFKFSPYFLLNLTRQFKKGVYEVFLQEYHRCTENGLDDKYNSIRRFVRYDIGDLPLYYAVNNGVYFIEENINCPSFSFNEKVLSDINDFGFYTMMMFGNDFFLEVTPRAEITRKVFLRKENAIYTESVFYNGIKEMKYVTEIDFLLRKLREKK